MKKYTQEEFDNFEVDEYGFKICPTGDYSGIHSFGNLCSFGEECSFGEKCSFGDGCRFGGECIFGEWCSLGERCSFGERCNFENNRVKNGTYFACDRIGSEKRRTYFFKCDDGFFVRAGCFFGTMDEFKERVKKVHAGTIHEKSYLMACDLAEVVLGK